MKLTCTARKGLPLKINLFIFSFLFLSIGLFAQTDSSKSNSIEFKGRVENMDTGAGLDGVFVFALDEKGDTLAQRVTTANGKYKTIQLKFGNTYTIWYKKVGFLSKHILLDCSNLPDSSSKKLSYPLDADLSLTENYSQRYPECLTDIEKKPVAMAKYDANTENFEWNMKLTENYKKQLEKLINCFET